MRPVADVYMTIVGALLWLAACTRPDLAYSVSVLARFVSNPALEHFKAMQRVLVYLQCTAARPLIYKATGAPLCAYSDADWSERQSTSGAVFFVCGCVVAWYSRLQRCISHSTAEAEFIGASMAAREGMFLRDVLKDLGYGPEGPTILYLDSKSAIDLAFDAVAFKKTKHVLRDAYFLRDLVMRLVYKPVHVCSADQLADIQTKALPRITFSRLVDMIMGVKSVDNLRQRLGSRRG